MSSCSIAAVYLQHIHSAVLHVHWIDLQCIKEVQQSRRTGIALHFGMGIHIHKCSLLVVSSVTQHSGTQAVSNGGQVHETNSEAIIMELYWVMKDQIQYFYMDIIRHCWASLWEQCHLLPFSL